MNFSAAINGRRLEIVSKPGLPAWDQITPTQALLAEHVLPEGHTLLMGCDHGALAAALVGQGVTALTCTDESLVALQMTAQTLQANRLPAADLIPPLTIAGRYDTVVIRLPKGRKLARRWLVQAYWALAPGGACYLAGANPEGIQAVLKDAGELFGATSVLGYRKGCRVGRMRKPSGHSAMPAWASQPGISPGTWQEFPVQAAGLEFRIRSLPGVFSFDRLDDGSRLLLENLALPEGRRVLDFGCGCGVLGMAAARMGAVQADLVDVNLLAVAAAEENLRVNQIGNGRVLPSDLLEAVHDRRYDAIITNPPFHAGREVNTEITQRFVRQAQDCLVPGGALVLVANRFLRYELFGKVETLAANNQYHILKATKP
ncbi:MAG: methyltransferase [Chloroflexota bacterium]